MRFRLVSLLVLSALLSGCSTAIKVTTVPSGGEVFARGSGRAAYKWDKKGTDGVVYKSPYSADIIVAVWEDGSRTLPLRVSHMFKKEIEVTLVKGSVK